MTRPCNASPAVSQSRGMRQAGILAVAILLVFASAVLSQGIALTGVGPINRSMGGAATACPLDAIGAIQWNPATISGLPSSELSAGAGLILPSERLSSSLFGLSGSDRAEPGVTPIPYIALVHKPCESPWSYGLGMFGIAGYSVNYPASLTNPILSPSGLGRITSELQILQLAPTVSRVLSPNLSIGFAPTLTIAKLTADPFPFATPNSFLDYPSGNGSRWAWGGGFQVGAYYKTGDAWHFGAAVKTPQWMEGFRFKSEDAFGAPRTLTLALDYPLIVTTGAAYTGFENWTLACDVRYFDYEHADGFESTGFGPDGAMAGLGWDSVWSVNLGVERRLGERLFVRSGYSFNENPISDAAAMFNVASPLIFQHILYLGASFKMTDNWMASLTYAHAFENEISGPIILPPGGPLPAGPIPGSSVTSEMSADTVDAAITVRF